VENLSRHRTTCSPPTMSVRGTKHPASMKAHSSITARAKPRAPKEGKGPLTNDPETKTERNGMTEHVGDRLKYLLNETIEEQKRRSELLKARQEQEAVQEGGGVAVAERAPGVTDEDLPRVPVRTASPKSTEMGQIEVTSSEHNVGPNDAPTIEWRRTPEGDDTPASEEGTALGPEVQGTTRSDEGRPESPSTTTQEDDEKSRGERPPKRRKTRSSAGWKASEE
jgi:hypothetical protein